MLTISTNKNDEVLSVNSIPAVEVSMSLPCFSGGSRVSTGRINKYYKRFGEKYMADIRKKLLPEAAKLMGSLEIPELFQPITVNISYTLTECSEDYVSLYIDITEKTGSGRGITVRRADTWRVLSGLPLYLEDVLEKRPSVLKQCLPIIEEQIAYALSNRIGEFSTNYRRLLRRNFKRENFYIKDGDITVFFPSGTVAPVYEGFPSFVVSKLFRGCKAENGENSTTNDKTFTNGHIN